uniref:Uncharacterized protein n=1 Tax=Avena sativa TaxID=4498 RepID=A0ACD5Z7R2_AVESA
MVGFRFLLLPLHDFIVREGGLRLTYAVVVLQPLAPDWEGFPGQLAESIKASYAERSYQGAPEYQCRNCGAAFWWEERVKSASAEELRRVVYNLCCKGGKVYIPPFKKPPPFLSGLMLFDGDRRAKHFVSKIRQYNCLFSFTSMGAKIDRSVNNTCGPNIFKIQGAVCHRMGSLLPERSDAPGAIGGREPPKFAELYIYDTTNEVRNRISAVNPDNDKKKDPDPVIVAGITDAVGHGFVDGGDIGKSIILPSSHTGGRRYFQENFQDALAVARVYGAPDLFSTFTCNPKWPEITEALLLEPGQRASDRADLAVRVYNMKLNEYLDDIKSGRAYGPIKAVLHTVEFQKRGLPHAHIIIWLKRLDTEIPISPLSELNPTSRDWTIHVYVSRLWQHRGSVDDGPIKHTDMVFLDAQGSHMYGEISPLLVPDFIERIREGKVYELRKFLVCQKKNYFRPVEGDFMIRFGRYTTVRELNDNIMDYPLCTYALTPIDDLPAPADLPESFTDVVGVITGVSPTSQFHSASRSTPSTKRIVYLSDLSGFEISDGPVVVLFVGTLVKPFEGRRGLSGSASCRWYINEDLPEINELLDQLKDKVPAVRGITLQCQTVTEISAQVDLETKTVAELAALDIYDHKQSKFYCTVVITKLSPGERWWFHACSACGKGTIPYGAAYRCSNTECRATRGAPRYRACYLGSDGTGEIEFVFFEKTGRELIGKPVLTLIRASAPNAMSVDEAIQFARTDQRIPRELASVVLKKYRLVVSVSSKSFLPESMVNSYQVHRVEVQQGRHPRSPALGRRLGLAMASTNSSAGTSGLSPAGQALTDDLLLSQATSLGTSTPLSDPPDGSMVDSESLQLPSAPSSVTKPTIPLGDKDKLVSDVHRALFTDDSPERESETTAASPLQLQHKEMSQLQTDEVPLPAVVATHVPPAPATADSTNKTFTGRKRQLSLKAQAAVADGSLKKKKN